MTEKFNLNWHSFQNHTNDLLSELYSSAKFSDVTLICDDQTQFRTHKFILNSCSSVFRDILSINSHVPCIYLRGIEKEEMESVLQFMYLGEATFYHERMNKFLDVARDLDVKEIVKSIDINEEGWIISYVASNTMKVHNDKSNSNEEGSVSSGEFTESFENTENVSNNFPVANEKSRNYQNTESLANSTDDSKYPGQQCENKANRLDNLNIHAKSKHEVMMYPCHHCDYKATFPSRLLNHVKAKHEGVRYQCQQCEYKAYDVSNLSRHVKSKHDGVRYPCQHCDYEATKWSNLYRHVSLKH